MLLLITFFLILKEKQKKNLEFFGSIAQQLERIPTEQRNEFEKSMIRIAEAYQKTESNSSFITKDYTEGAKRGAISCAKSHALESLPKIK